MKVKSTYGAFRNAVKEAALKAKVGTEHTIWEWAELANVDYHVILNYARVDGSLLKKVSRGVYRRVAG